jgi:lipoyl synthase
MALDQRPDFSSLGELNVVSNGGHVSPSEVMYPGGPTLDGGLLAPGDPMPENAGPGGRRPDWLKVRIGAGSTYAGTRSIVQSGALNTVCEEARCPNIGECWALGTATIMILGSVCTRNCGFCAIDTGRPPVTDLDEPRRVAEAVRQMRLQHVVITMVARDDLPDGGAEIVAATIRQIRLANRGTGIEVLISDLNGRENDIRTVVEAQPDILGHNVETVPRLQRPVRRRARWDRSVSVLTVGRRTAEEVGHSMVTKTGMMLGLGESWDEVLEAMRLLREADIDVLTLGQYLRPSRQHLPLLRYWTPAEFLALRRIGLEMGFRHVQSGPLVRSSYHAAEQVPGSQAAAV